MPVFVPKTNWGTTGHNSLTAADANRIEQGIADANLITGLLPSGDSFRFDSTRLGTFKTALGLRNAAPVRILAVGDSRTEGDQSTVANRWVNQLQGLLRSTYAVTGSPPGGLGYVPARYIAATTITNPWAYTGTKSALTSSGLGVARGYQLSAGATATLAFTGTGADIHYLRGSTGGNWTWAIDGGGATTVNSNQTFTQEAITTIRGLSAGAHTLVVTNVTTNTFLQGAFIYNGDEGKGFNLYEAGHAGATSADMVDASSSAYDAYRIVSPHLVFIDLTTNDWGIGGAAGGSGTLRLPPRAVAANIRDIIAGARSGGTDPSIVLVEPVKRGAAINTVAMKAQWSDYTQMLRKLALEDGRITLFDQQTALGDFSTGSNPNANADQTHFTAVGHAANAQAIADLLAAA